MMLYSNIKHRICENRAAAQTLKASLQPTDTHFVQKYLKILAKTSSEERDNRWSDWLVSHF